MLPGYFAIISALVAAVGGFVYLYDTITGKAKPNRVTWLLWGVLPMIIFVAQHVQGVTGISWISFAAGFTPLLIVTASFLNKKAYWQTAPLDYVCMLLAFVGMGLWAVTSNANLAIVFSILADFAAGFPTFKKAYTHPETESWKAFAISAAGFLLGVLAIHTWTFANYSFVSYLLLSETTLTLLAIRSRKPSREEVPV